jgi:hypothetical protein
MYSRYGILGLACAGLALLVLGCQGEPLPDGMPKLCPVSVTIVQEGKPLANASIRLIPDDSTNKWSSGGSTNESGVAKLFTHGKFAGVPAGSYKVTVTKIEMPAPVSADQQKLLEKSASADEPTYDLVPAQYSLPNQTPLRLTVKSEGNTYEPFDLGPAVREVRKGPPTH